MPSPVLIGLLSAAATALLVLGLGRWLGPRGWMDLPSARKRHGRPVPRVGGLALLLVLLAAKALGWLHLKMSAAEWTAILTMALVGVLDDRFNLRARWKALVGGAVAVSLAWIHTAQLLDQGAAMTLFGMALPGSAWVYGPLLLAWYWGIPQAFNLIDGLNGLCLGFSTLLLGALCVGPFALLGGGSAPLWGALVALLLLNYPRAWHFLGDTGSLTLGVLFATQVMERAMPYHRGLAFWMMAYPVLDVTTVVLIRKVTGRPLGSPDRNHMHHWLHDRLQGHNWLVPVIILLPAGLSMARDFPWAWGPAASLVGFLGLVALALLVFVDRAFLNPLEPAAPQPKPSHPLFNDATGAYSHLEPGDSLD